MTFFTHRAYAPLETLERRTLLAIAALEGGLLEVTGTDAGNDFVVRISPENVDHIQVFDGQTIETYVRSTVRSVRLIGFGGDDEFFVDNRFGFVSKTGSGLPITIDGGEGGDRLVLVGDAGGTTIATGIAVGETPDTGLVLTKNHKSAQIVAYAGIDEIFDLTTATELTVSGNGSSNVIEIVNGPTINGAVTGQVRIFNATSCDDGSHDHDAADRLLQTTFAPITFANKRGLVVRGNGGHDFVDLDVSQQPAGLDSLVIDGGRGIDRLAAQQARGVGYVAYRDVERRERQRSFTLLASCPSVATVSEFDVGNDDGGDVDERGGDSGNGRGSPDDASHTNGSHSGSSGSNNASDSRGAGGGHSGGSNGSSS